VTINIVIITENNIFYYISSEVIYSVTLTIFSELLTAFKIKDHSTISFCDY